MNRTIPALLTSIVLFVGLAACEPGITSSQTISAAAAAVDASSTSSANAAAPFLTWHQGFNHDTDGWITDGIPGPDGWCGDVARVERGESAIAPSVGRAHATVSQGACNEFWQENGWPSSGPYSSGAGMSEEWPASGYVTDLDIYLDPSWTAPEVFTYAISIVLLDQGFPDGLRYFMVPVTTSNGELQVAGHPVEDAGWYTFRYTVGDADGQLSIVFELARHGAALFSQPLTASAYAGAETSAIEPTNVGSGYVWFVAVAEGFDLPIDEHRVRRGR